MAPCSDMVVLASCACPCFIAMSPRIRAKLREATIANVLRFIVLPPVNRCFAPSQNPRFPESESLPLPDNMLFTSAVRLSEIDEAPGETSATPRYF